MGNEVSLLQVAKPDSSGEMLAVNPWHIDRTVEAYREGCSSAFVMTPLSSESCAETFRIDAWFTEKCVFMQNRTGAFTFWRTKAQLESAGHLVVVLRHLSGSTRAISGSEIIHRAPGEFCFMDQSIPIEAVQESGEFQTIYLDKRLLEYDPSIHPRFRRIDPKSTIGACIDSVWNALFNDLWMNGKLVSEPAIDQLISCIKIAIGVHAEREDVRVHARRALHAVICRYIETNLGDMELSPNSILRAFGLSRASLFRMFEPDGGVRTYIRNRRLSRALIDIAHNPTERGEVRKAADRWGFSSPPNFNRSVRTEFGQTPSRLFRHDYALPAQDSGSRYARFVDHATTFEDAQRISVTT